MPNSAAVSRPVEKPDTRDAATVASLIVLWFVRLAGLAQIALGVLFWTGHAVGLLRIHLVLGFAIVGALWALAIMAVAAGSRVGLPIASLILGLALPGIGIPQASLLVGSWHWAVRVLHLLMGLMALGFADGLATRIRGARR